MVCAVSGAPLMVDLQAVTKKASLMIEGGPLCGDACMADWHRAGVDPCPTWGTSLLRKLTTLGTYRRPMPRVLGGS